MQFLLQPRAALGLPMEHGRASLPVFALTFSVEGPCFSEWLTPHHPEPPLVCKHSLGANSSLSNFIFNMNPLHEALSEKSARTLCFGPTITPE